MGQTTSPKRKEIGTIRFREVQGAQIEEAGMELSTFFDWEYSSFANDNPYTIHSRSRLPFEN